MLFIPKVIQKKRDGEALTTEEIEFFIKSISDKTVTDAQIGAMLMAVYLKGLTYPETVALTKSMTESGQILNFPKGPKLVDKHSTGGVGDKISLILAPALAACGFRVPMISGRGLAFTGGTLDKLESIPGFKVELSFDEMKNCLEKVGCFIGGATSSLAPADGVLYKHRDVTSTVDSAPLIASSILSKKAAEGVETLVMDMKVGCGSFLKDLEATRKLSRMMVEVASGLGIKMKAVLSEMNNPIGQCVGNALEVEESINCLRNTGSSDVTELVKVLGGVLLVTEGMARDLEEGKSVIQKTLEDGSALKKFENMLVLQGVKENVAKEVCHGNMWNVLQKANHVTKLKASNTGFITNINALDIAYACWYLGAGRSKAGDPIDPAVGVKFLKVVGDRVEQNEPWVEIHHTDSKIKSEIENLIKNSLVVKNENVQKKSRIIEII